MMTAVPPASSNGHVPDAGQRVLDALGNEFTPYSLEILAAGALTPEQAVRFGVRAVRLPEHVPEEIARYWITGPGRGPGMLFEWRDLDRTVVQFRPDVPVVDEAGEAHKYILPKGCGSFLSHLRAPAEDSAPYLFVEGTKQGLAAAVWAPAAWGVVAVPGCNSWIGTDLSWAEGRRVVVLFDADVATNRNVHDAAVAFKEALEAEGADEIVFAKLAGAKAREGLDDVLGRRAPERRESYIQRIAEAAVTKLGRPPSRRTESAYFTDKGLLARTASLAVLEDQPAALAIGSMISLYRGGAFRMERGREPLIARVKTMLGEDFRPNWRATIEEYLVGELAERGMRLPDRQPRPLLNCANGMLDLETGELLEHSPKYLSALQIPIAWTPDAQCPVYEDWLRQVIPNQYTSLEEVASTMLDPSRTPSRALFAFGPSRSGKGTFLRLIEAIAGKGNVSGVSLLQLSDNKFMSSAVYQKMVNVSGDLSAAHVSDISLFKMLTGEDLIEADRKYGLPFRFTNQALFVFAANELPTVSETSRAYVNRIKPYRFGKTFAGREDPTIEAAMLQELPGILCRWVAAWRAFNERGTYLPTAPDVAEEFETKSDRVARWVATRCDIHPDVAGQLVGAEHGEGLSVLYKAFQAWVKDDGGADPMSRPKFAERLRTIPGVGEVRLRHRSKNLGVNVTTHTGEDREPVKIQPNQDTEVSQSVGSVGSGTSLPYVGSEKEIIKGVSQSAYGRNGLTAHTTHTVPHPVPGSRTAADDAAVKFLSGGPQPTLPTPDGGPVPPKPRAVSDADALAFLFGPLPATTECEADALPAPPDPLPEPNPSAAPAAEPTDPDDGFDWES